LEGQLASLDTKMKTEITEFIKAVEDEMEAILDELCAREIIQVRDSYDPQRLEILKELKNREDRENKQ
jgi:molecular chaperone GrpE (heat shock protein)